MNLSFALPNRFISRVSEEVLPLDHDILNPITLITKDNTEFIINSVHAKQSKIISSLMELDPDTNTIILSKLDSNQVQLAVDYLMDPENTNTRWNVNSLVNVVHVANMLGIISMLKDALNQLCFHIPFQPDDFLNDLFSRIKLEVQEDGIENALLHCTDQHPNAKWTLSQKALKKRTNLRTLCKVRENNGMRSILNANYECLKYLKMNNLFLIVQWQLIYDNLESIHAAAHGLDVMDLRIELTLYSWNVNMPFLIDTLTNVPRLTQLTLKQVNGILDFSIFSDMPELSKLTAQQCQLKDISGLIQSKLPKLRMIDLRDNEIETVGKISFMPQLKKLILESNHISNVDHLFSSRLSNLIELNLSTNRLEHIGRIDFLLKLQVLNLSLNQLSWSVLLFQSHLPNLNKLNLHGNLLKSVERIYHMPKLSFLSLNHNEITKISELLQSDLKELMILDLEGNRLESVEYIHSMDNLEELNIRNNRLSNVTGLFQSHLPALKKLDICENFLKTIGKIESMPKLETLLLERNPLQDISDFVHSDLPKLQQLTLRKNLFESLERNFPNLNGLNMNSDRELRFGICRL